MSNHLCLTVAILAVPWLRLLTRPKWAKREGQVWICSRLINGRKSVLLSCVATAGVETAAETFQISFVVIYSTWWNNEGPRVKHVTFMVHNVTNLCPDGRSNAATSAVIVSWVTTKLHKYPVDTTLRNDCRGCKSSATCNLRQSNCLNEPFESGRGGGQQELGNAAGNFTHVSLFPHIHYVHIRVVRL